MDNLKRHSLSGMLPKHHHDMAKKGSAPSSPKPTTPRNKLELMRESPPSVFFGPPEASSGVLLSGVLRVSVVEAHITLESFSLRLVSRATQKKPVVKDCPKCTVQDTEIKVWDFLSERKTLMSGSHNFPFSHLIPGRLPATSNGKLGQIEYFLLAIAKTTSGETLRLDEELRILRSLAVSPEKHSLRIFPPTKIEAHLSLLPVIHPIGRFVASFSLRNIVNPPLPRRPDVHTRWSVRKLVWKLEETERTIAPACDRHAAKVGGEGKGKEYEEVRQLAKEELFGGWKRDYSPPGDISLEFAIALTPTRRALCDVITPKGMRITHHLIVELVVAEEWVSNANSNKWGPTGQARVLRCQFGLKVTERAGLGISWDEEEPPLYEDMTQGPPPDYEREFGLPPLTNEQREEITQRARGEARRVEMEEPPSSPPLYGVNSRMEETRLEEVLEELEGVDLEERRRHREETRFGREDLEGWEEDTEERGEAQVGVREEEDYGEEDEATAEGTSSTYREG